MAGEGFKIADGYVEIHTKYDGAQVADAIGKELGKADGDIRRTADRHVSESIVRGSEDGVNRRRGRLRGLGSSIVGSIFGKGFPNIFVRGLLEGMTVGLANAQGFGALGSNPALAAIGLTMGAAILTSAVSGLSATLLAGIGGAFSIGLLGLAAFILKNNPAVANAGKVLGNSFMQEFTKATAQLAGPVVTALNILDNTLRLNHQLWRHLFEPLVPVIPALALGLDGFVRNLAPGLNALSAIGANVLMDLANHLPQLGTSLSNFFLQMMQNWPAIDDSFKLFMSDVGTLIGWLAQAILWLGSHYRQIRAFMLGYMQAVFLPIIALIAGIKLIGGWITKFLLWLDRARRDTGSWGGAMKLIIFNMATSFLATLLGLVLKAIGLFGSLYSGTKRLFGFIKDAVIIAIIATAGGMISRVASAVGAVLRYFGGMPGAVARNMSGIRSAVIGTFAAAGGWLYSAGSRIISGLIDGVRSRIGELRNQLSNLTSMIPDWKGPMDVDAKLLVPNGQAVIKGFMKGIGDMVPPLEGQLGGVTSSIPAMVPTQRGGAVGSGPTTINRGLTVNLTVHAGIGTDGKAVGREAARALKIAIDDYDRSVKR